MMAKKITLPSGEELTESAFCVIHIGMVVVCRGSSILQSYTTKN